MSQSIYHYTYIITNTTNQMKYIGVRSCSCLPENDDGYMGSSKILGEAMEETPESFTKTIIETFSTRENANADEQRLHEMYDVARNSEFYNLMNAPLGFCTAGKTGKDSYWYGKHLPEETRKKISESEKGKILSTETKRKMSLAQSGENNNMYGKKHSTEIRKKISKSQLGKRKPQKKIQCPHCSKIGGNVMKRHHFSNCREIS
jgi:hypothetical protein